MRADEPSPPPPAGGARCPDCTSPLDGDQRYCLNCGARVADVAYALRPRRPAAVAPAPAPSAPPPRLLPAALGHLRGTRGGAAALAGALAVGVLAGIASAPGTPVARSVVLASAPAVAVPGAAVSGDVASLQAAAAAAAPEVTAEPAVSEPITTAGTGPASEDPAAEPEAQTTTAEPKKETTPAEDSPPPATSGTATETPAPARPPIKHVTVVALAGAEIADVYGAGTRAPYLARELRAQGLLLHDYFETAHGNLPNLVALLSGQTTDPAAPSLPAQLEQAQLRWHAYVEGADAPDGAPPAPCSPPPAAPDGSPAPIDRNPFQFFAALAAAADCSAKVTGLATLAADLAAPAADAPAFTLVVPDACHGGRAGACAAGEPDGIARADTWLREWIPPLLAAPAFADDGLVVILFAEGRPEAEGRTGALLLSPHVEAGASSAETYNHYSLLRTIEDAFSLEHLAFAAEDRVNPLGSDVFAAP